MNFHFGVNILNIPSENSHFEWWPYWLLLHAGLTELLVNFRTFHDVRPLIPVKFTCVTESHVHSIPRDSPREGEQQNQ